MSGRRLAVQTVEAATVAGLTHTGEGIVRGGKTVFVPGALPGESIRFRRTRSHRQHDEAELLEVLEPAPARVLPRCPHFGVCGGCALQHLSPEAQLEAKQTELRDNFDRVGRVTPKTWLPPLRGPVWGYRRRARLGAKFVTKKGRVVVGFRERLAPYIADVRHCDVLAAPVGDLITPLSDMLTGLSIRERVPQIEVAVADNAVALVFRVLDAPSAADLERLREFGTAQAVRVYLQPKGLDSIHELGPVGEEGGGAARGGAPPLHYRLPKFAVQLEFVPTDFIQINGPVNEELVSRAVELLELTPSSRVLDLYCGLGNFTLAMAKSAGRVVGVEGDAALVARARHNAQLNRCENAEFHVADLAQPPLPGSAAGKAAPWLREAYTHVVLDPPRVGAREVLASVAALEPQRVLYISCHPGSLARDLGVLVNEHGFTLEAAGVLDMFPHTAHFESLALLTAR
ncbi:MAG: SAM-dependent methyltransferase [Gammaproteobacteria bacterium]|nr:SAM-dependent methyltransferase [Gammaproteobacteria bacterium]